MKLEFAKLEEEPAKHSTSVRRSGSKVTYRPPPAGWIKCNVDAAFVETRSTGATTAVYRDPNGSLLTGINSTIVATSPLAAEALAVREALIMSTNFQMEKVIIESDNQILVQALKSHASIADIQVILDDILYLVKGIPNCGFTWAPKEENLLAHEVAKLTEDGEVDSGLEVGTLAKEMRDSEVTRRRKGELEPVLWRRVDAPPAGKKIESAAEDEIGL
ncbi:uncharacterized protein LOC130949302 [Arachis stenosperma]|uniref:uncharacterized protein LOC130949302 n=1 Tax=Arachis stenosperma TaxID=217475 RepID=UPI0025ACBC61|nr:uncharacterized protein LOC130949302 [Arachis stenosperma]